MQNENVIERLTREVLRAGRGAALPSRLSDDWIDRASKCIDEMLAGQSRADAESQIGLMLVLKILADKDPTGKPPLEIPLEALQEYLEAYRFALSLEKISRVSDLRASPATLENIFDLDREVQVNRRLPCSFVGGTTNSVQ